MHYLMNKHLNVIEKAEIIKLIDIKLSYLKLIS